MAFLLLLAVLGLVFGAATGIVLLSPLRLNQTADPARIATTAATAFLSAANMSVILSNHRTRVATTGAGSMTGLGLISSVFVGACPLCQPAWLFWVGLGSVSGFLGAFGLAFGIAGIAFLLWALKISLESGTCVMKR